MNTTWAALFSLLLKWCSLLQRSLPYSFNYCVSEDIVPTFIRVLYRCSVGICQYVNTRTIFHDIHITQWNIPLQFVLGFWVNNHVHGTVFLPERETRSDTKNSKLYHGSQRNQLPKFPKFSKVKPKNSPPQQIQNKNTGSAFRSFNYKRHFLSVLLWLNVLLSI